MDRARTLVVLYTLVGVCYLAAGGRTLLAEGYDLGGALLAFGGLLLVASGLWNLARPDGDYGFGDLAERDWFFWTQVAATAALALGFALSVF